MARTRIWIMDGHNMIFALPGLKRLQVSDRREEARARLTEALGRFAAARGEKVLVVFDGNEMASGRGARESRWVEVAYTRRGAEVADDLILREAGRCVERGVPVTVVTDDRSTLALKLPRRVTHLGVREFWLRFIEPERRDDEGKRVDGDFSDIERALLAAAAETPVSPEDRAAASAPGGRSAREAAFSPGRGAPSGPLEDATPQERLRRKRARGRARHRRLLERYKRPLGRR